MSDNGILTLHRQNCSSRLEWFVCKKDSTAVTKTYHTDKATESNYGVILGGSIGAVTVLMIDFTVVLCKVRRVGFFKNNTSAETTNVVFKNSVNGKDPILEVQTPQHVNIDGRKLNTSENTYDSNAGVRNHIDPTYDTATSSTKVDTDNTYDVSDLGLQIDRTNYAAYDQAC